MRLSPVVILFLAMNVAAAPAPNVPSHKPFDPLCLGYEVVLSLAPRAVAAYERRALRAIHGMHVAPLWRAAFAFRRTHTSTAQIAVRDEHQPIAMVHSLRELRGGEPTVGLPLQCAQGCCVLSMPDDASRYATRLCFDETDAVSYVEIGRRSPPPRTRPNLDVALGCDQGPQENLYSCIAQQLADRKVARALLRELLEASMSSDQSLASIARPILQSLLILPPVTAGDVELHTALVADRDHGIDRLEQAARRTPRGRWQREACLPLTLTSVDADDAPDLLSFCITYLPDAIGERASIGAVLKQALHDAGQLGTCQRI